MSSAIKAYVSPMVTSAGTDHFVVVECAGRMITPHAYQIKGRAEFDAAEWNWVFNGGEKPDILDFDTDGPEEPVVMQQSETPSPIEEAKANAETMRRNGYTISDIIREVSGRSEHSGYDRGDDHIALYFGRDLLLISLSGAEIYRRA